MREYASIINRTNRFNDSEFRYLYQSVDGEEGRDSCVKVPLEAACVNGYNELDGMRARIPPVNPDFESFFDRENYCETCVKLPIKFHPMEFDEYTNNSVVRYAVDCRGQEDIEREYPDAFINNS